jgi:hypothetical protein
MTASVRVPGRTRWAVFDPEGDVFYVNIADPAEILVLTSDQPDRVACTIAIAAPGPHGLDFDPEQRRLFCACDRWFSWRHRRFRTLTSPIPVMPTVHQKHAPPLGGAALTDTTSKDIPDGGLRSPAFLNLTSYLCTSEAHAKTEDFRLPGENLPAL